MRDSRLLWFASAMPWLVVVGVGLGDPTTGDPNAS
jgi:hypothetical protein